MFYILSRSKKHKNSYLVVDTNDNSCEVHTVDTILSYKGDIAGVERMRSNQSKAYNIIIYPLVSILLEAYKECIQYKRAYLNKLTTCSEFKDMVKDNKVLIGHFVEDGSEWAREVDLKKSLRYQLEPEEIEEVFDTGFSMIIYQNIKYCNDYIACDIKASNRGRYISDMYIPYYIDDDDDIAEVIDIYSDLIKDNSDWYCVDGYMVCERKKLEVIPKRVEDFYDVFEA